MSRPALAVTALLALLAGCPKSAAQEPVQKVVASVDGQPIYGHELTRAISGYPEKASDAASRVALATALLDNLILERILIGEALREGIEVPKEEVVEVLERTAQGYRVRDFQELLHGVFLTPAMLRDRVTDRLRVERLLAAHVPDAPLPDEAALRAHYDAHPEDFRVPEQVRARQILVRTREQAEQLRERAHKEPFEQLARKHSLAPEADRGGDLGFFGRGTMPKVFDDFCFTLEPGKISEAVASEYGFHVFQVIEARPAETVPFDEARDRILRKLSAENRRASADLYVAELRARAKVVRHLDVLAGLVGTSAVASVDAAAKEE